MSIASSPIPAGWYPDPAGSFQQRWWNGESWSNDFAQYRPTLVHSAPVAEGVLSEDAQRLLQANAVVLQQQAAASAAQASGQEGRSHTPTQTMTRQASTGFDATPLNPGSAARLPDDDQPPQTTVAQPNAARVSLVAVAPPHGSAALDANVEQKYMPFGPIREQPRHQYPVHPVHPDRRYTVAVWLLAVLPAVLIGGAYALATIAPALYTTLAVVLLLVLFLGISVVLAAVDRRTLRMHGHVFTASPALALLTPLVFLPVRTAVTARETDRITIAPLIVLLLVLAGIAVALLFVPGLISLLLTASALY